MSDNSGAFQHFPLAARPIQTAILERRNDALTVLAKMPERLSHIGRGYEFHSIVATLSGFRLSFESPLPWVFESVDWVPVVEDYDGYYRPFTHQQWPSEIEVSVEEAARYNTLLAPIWASVERAFLDAALAGEEAIYARIGSPVERSVTRIPPDVWANFDVVDWKTGRAIVPGTDHVLYGACSVAVPPGGDNRPSSPEQALALLVRENENRVASGLSPLTITETETWAKREGFTRDEARALRERLPDALKLKAGQKKRDLRT